MRVFFNVRKKGLFDDKRLVVGARALGVRGA